ncbi:WxL domain-containing protein [Companilactobacillus insicii]|uniref:WxL domain-containing protein n=1 Tax=Companilactobacillus insicii TaxID=1732567 RepID=UPI000F78903E|nr:WxL domain-containing protein [Companilactobacillus insicii]
MILSKVINSIIISLSAFFLYSPVAQAATTDASSLDNSNNVAITTDNSANNDTSDTKTSNVSVKVITGLLTLDAVPNFNFGNGASGTTLNLKDNSDDGDIIVDGNSQGILQVTESRKNADGQTPGFNLSARLNSFTSNGQKINGFSMTLNPEELYDADGDNVSTTSNKITTNKARLTAGSNQETNVMNLAAGSYKAGTITTSFTTSDSASLYVPKNADTSSKPAKKYSSSIVWTLTPTPSVN